MLTKYWRHILLIIGLTLFIVGLMFHFLNWPDAFYGIITGPIFILIVLTSIVTKDKNTESSRLISSRITGFYKYILPFLSIGLLIASTILSFIKNGHQDLFIGLSIGLLVMAVLIIILSITIWEVRMDDDFLYFRGFRKEIKKRISEMEGINEDLNGLMYRIDFKDRGYYFMPDFLERIQNLFGVPDSVEEINKRKAAVHNHKK